MSECKEYKELIGKTAVSVKNIDNEELVFSFDTGDVYKFFHMQDCCESVTIEDICGDLNDLVGVPLLRVEEVVSNEDPDGYVGTSEYRDCFTWTFYKFSTIKGSVTVRWYGESNGYYSESVDFCKVE